MEVIDLVSRNKLIDLYGPRALNLRSVEFIVLNNDPFPILKLRAVSFLPGKHLSLR